MKPIKDLLVAKDVPVDDPNDATLSGSEHAQAIIIAALVEQWDRLDGGQQRSVVEALEASTVMTEEPKPGRGIVSALLNQGDNDDRYH